jgi:hypothetical protein
MNPDTPAAGQRTITLVFNGTSLLSRPAGGR